jgi:acetyl esterase/lipase
MLERGITVAVVKYRLPNHHREVPYADVANTFRYCRAHAAEWHLNQIGVMGFSAGGHLAASASNLFVDEITRPDFSILIYPVITMHEKYTHQGTRKNLLGENQTKEMLRRYSLQKQVTEHTPVTFLAHCTDDKTVPVENSLRYYQRLIHHNVPAEMHIYPTGGHGWGFSSEKFVGKGNDRFIYARSEFEKSLERWLADIRTK